MELLNQFQGFIGSVGFGFFFFLFIHPINVVFKKTTPFIKTIIFVFFFLIGTYSYFLFLVKFTFGIMNIFYPLSLVIGSLFYYYFYYEKFNGFYNRIFGCLTSMIKLKYKKLFDIIIKKLKGERKNGKLGKNKK